ncbi:TOPRS ligase, partial [Chloroceryle aenea]|nr:TOPRS ligase [Chloroceryle aenea]
VATETEWSCPICHDVRDDVAYIVPCGHRFCLRCSLRWTAVTPRCPLCRQQVDAVRMPVQGGNSVQMAVAHLDESPSDSSQAGTALVRLAQDRPQVPLASPPLPQQETQSPAAEQQAAGTAVGGLLPHVWAELFQRHERLLDPVLTWLHQQLEEIYGGQWWMIKCIETMILYILCDCGPDEEAMIEMLYLHDAEESVIWLIRGTINVIEQQCSEQAQRLLRASVAREGDNPVASSGFSSSRSSQGVTPAHDARENNSPVASSSSSSSRASRGVTPPPTPASSTSPAGSDQEEAASTTEAALHGGPGCPPSAPGPAEPEQPQEEPAEAEAAEGPSGQGYRHRPSTSGQGRGRSASGHGRPPKRRARSPQDSPQPRKRPSRKRPPRR